MVRPFQILAEPLQEERQVQDFETVEGHPCERRAQTFVVRDESVSNGCRGYGVEKIACVTLLHRPALEALSENEGTRRANRHAKALNGGQAIDPALPAALQRPRFMREPPRQEGGPFTEKL